MAKQITQLNVLIASPGDVRAEREAAARIVNEVNRFLEKQEVHLRPQLWEYDSVSQIGDRPQALLNEQIADSCDIFVGIMWSRVGTPTGEFASGTIEEFSRAKARYEKDPRSIRILFLFCDRPLPTTLDLDQFAAVRKFRQQVEQIGLVSSYSSQEEFELKFRQSIHKHAIEWGDAWGNDSQQRPAVSTDAAKSQLIISDTSELIYPTEEIGFLDAIEESTDDATVAASALNRIVEAIGDLGQQINQRTEDFNKLGKYQPRDLRKAKKIANLAADHLETFATRVASDLPIQQKAFSNSLERMSDAVLLSQDFGTESERQTQLMSMQNTLQFLAEKMRTAIGSTLSFRQTIVESPRMTTRFNGARRQAEKVLNAFVDGARENVRLIETIQDQIGEILGDL